MAAFDDFLKKLNLTPDEAVQLENRAAPKFKWTSGHPIEIMTALERTLPPEWVDFEPETLMKMIRGYFGDVSKDEQKIYAVQVAMTTDRPWIDWDVFENSCLAFKGQIPIWGVLEPLDLHEIAFGLGVLDAIRQDNYSEDVLGYIASTYVYNGLLVQPPVGPDVKNIMARIGGSVPDGIQQIWDNGVRSSPENDPVDALEAQLQKMQIVNDWYHFGKDFKL
jgi:hypothetical protein